MGQIRIGMNLEATRHHDKPFEWGLDQAAEMGYEYVEPMVHFGRELMSEAGYYHTVSMFNDPMVMKEMVAQRGLKISGLQAHGPLGRPDYHGEYLKMAIRFAAECGAPVVNTDEGIKAPWTTEEEDFVLIKYTLAGGFFRGGTARRVDRPGMPRPVLEDARRTRSHLGPGRFAVDRHQSGYRQCLSGRTGSLPLAGTSRRSTGSSARQGYQRRAFGCRTGQGDRHTGRLCLRRRHYRLETRDRHLSPGTARYRVLGRVRHDRSGAAQPRSSQIVGVRSVAPTTSEKCTPPGRDAVLYATGTQPKPKQRAVRFGRVDRPTPWWHQVPVAMWNLTLL